MKNFLSSFKYLPLLLLSVMMLFSFGACNFDDCDYEEPATGRTEADILGVWTDGDGRYMMLDSLFHAYNLYLSENNEELLYAEWTYDGYLYEPGYNIVVYTTSNKADVFQVTELTDSELVWCPVKEFGVDDILNSDSVGKLLGQIINEAQQGFILDPYLYQYFYKISQEEFEALLESLGIMTPW